MVWRLPNGWDRADVERLAVSLVQQPFFAEGSEIVVEEAPRRLVDVLAEDVPETVVEQRPGVEPLELEVAVDVRFVVARTDGFRAEEGAWEQALAHAFAVAVGQVLRSTPTMSGLEDHGDFLTMAFSPAPQRPLGVLVGVDPWRTVEGPREAW